MNPIEAMPVKTSVVVPSMTTRYLKYLVFSLRGQTIKPWEVILVVKTSDEGLLEVKKLCEWSSLNCFIVERKRGYFTTALHMVRDQGKGLLCLISNVRICYRC